MLRQRRHHRRRSTRPRSRDATCELKPGRLYTQIREPYFFSYVRDELIAEYGANTVRSGGLQGLHDDRPAPPARGAARRSRDTLYYDDDPAAAVVSINPANGAIRAMTAVTPGRTSNQFNLARAGAPPGRARRSRPSCSRPAIDAGDQPATRPTTSRRRSTTSPTRTRDRRGTCSDLRPHLLGLDVDRSSATLALRQHRLRAADARRRPRRTSRTMAHKLGVARR